MSRSFARSWVRVAGCGCSAVAVVVLVADLGVVAARTGERRRRAAASPAEELLAAYERSRAGHLRRDPHVHPDLPRRPVPRLRRAARPGPARRPAPHRRRHGVGTPRRPDPPLRLTAAGANRCFEGAEAEPWDDEVARRGRRPRGPSCSAPTGSTTSSRARRTAASPSCWRSRCWPRPTASGPCSASTRPRGAPDADRDPAASRPPTCVETVELRTEVTEADLRPGRARRPGHRVNRRGPDAPPPPGRVGAVEPGTTGRPDGHDDRPGGRWRCVWREWTSAPPRSTVTAWGRTSRSEGVTARPEPDLERFFGDFPER